MRKLSWKFSVLFLCVISLCLVRCGDDDCPTCPKHPATLYLSVHKIDLGTTATSATFDIKNTGQKTLEWTITTSGANWLTVSPTSGTDSATITVTPDRDLIDTLGQLQAWVYITAGSLKDSVEVLIGYGGDWVISPDKIDLGATETSATFNISNTGELTLHWTITTSGANWLTVFPTTGTDNATITVTALRDSIDALGQHEAELYLSAGFLKDTVVVLITYGGSWSISIHKIHLGKTDTSDTFYIENTGSHNLDWTITTSGANWLTVSPDNGRNNDTIIVTAHRDSITTLGEHEAKLYLSGGPLKDTVEVFIAAGEWLVNDDETADICFPQQLAETYLVNLFHMPGGMTSCFVDSVKINLCDHGSIRLVAFDAPWGTWPVGEPVLSERWSHWEGLSWQAFAVNWYVATSHFCVGYYQPADDPRLVADDSPSSTVSFKKTGAGSWEYSSKVFHIRVYISPVPTYASGMLAGQRFLQLTPQERESLSRGQ